MRTKQTPYVAMILLFCQSTVSTPPLRAEQAVVQSTATAVSSEYKKPAPFIFIRQIPTDLRDYGRDTFRKENIGPIMMMVVGTGILISLDQYLVDKAVNLGDHLGISHTNYQKSFAEIGVPGLNKSLNIEGPFDSGSALYFLGDGWMDVIIIGGFLTVGLTRSDNRALQTSSQIVESLLTSGIVVQTLKHITGRESPFTATAPGGNWHFFPNQIEYSHHVPTYDAFPSGHLAAMMATITVIGENYSEYRFIRPVGYTAMGVVGFQMMNNGVHWISDYPLAIAIGYSLGHMAVQKGKGTYKAASWEFQPVVFNSGGGLLVSHRFGSKKKDDSDVPPHAPQWGG